MESRSPPIGQSLTPVTRPNLGPPPGEEGLMHAYAACPGLEAGEDEDVVQQLLQTGNASALDAAVASILDTPTYPALETHESSSFLIEPPSLDGGHHLHDPLGLETPQIIPPLTRRWQQPETQSMEGKGQLFPSPLVAPRPQPLSEGSAVRTPTPAGAKRPPKQGKTTRLGKERPKAPRNRSPTAARTPPQKAVSMERLKTAERRQLAPSQQNLTAQSRLPKSARRHQITAGSPDTVTSSACIELSAQHAQQNSEKSMLVEQQSVSLEQSPKSDAKCKSLRARLLKLSTDLPPISPTIGRKNPSTSDIAQRGGIQMGKWREMSPLLSPRVSPAAKADRRNLGRKRQSSSSTTSLLAMKRPRTPSQGKPQVEIPTSCRGNPPNDPRTPPLISKPPPMDLLEIHITDGEISALTGQCDQAETFEENIPHSSCPPGAAQSVQLENDTLSLYRSVVRQYRKFQKSGGQNRHADLKRARIERRIRSLFGDAAVDAESGSSTPSPPQKRRYISRGERAAPQSSVGCSRGNSQEDMPTPRSPSGRTTSNSRRVQQEHRAAHSGDNRSTSSEEERLDDDNTLTATAQELPVMPTPSMPEASAPTTASASARTPAAATPTIGSGQLTPAEQRQNDRLGIPPPDPQSEGSQPLQQSAPFTREQMNLLQNLSPAQINTIRLQLDSQANSASNAAVPIQAKREYVSKRFDRDTAAREVEKAFGKIDLLLAEQKTEVRQARLGVNMTLLSDAYARLREANSDFVRIVLEVKNEAAATVEQNYLDKLTEVYEEKLAQVTMATGQPASGSQEDSYRKDRLPPLHLPQFDPAGLEGKAAIFEYLIWRQSYDVMIHNKTDLSDEQKLLRLGQALKGSVRQQVLAHEHGARNYQAAIDTLERMFDNPYSVKMTLITALLSELVKRQAIVAKGTSVPIKQVRQLHTMVTNHLSHMAKREIHMGDEPVIVMTYEALPLYVKNALVGRGKVIQDIAKCTNKEVFLKELDHYIQQREQATLTSAAKRAESGERERTPRATMALYAGAQGREARRDKPRLQRNKNFGFPLRPQPRAFSEGRSGAAAHGKKYCYLCRATSHATDKCFKLTKIPVEKRAAVVKDLNVCFFCLNAPRHPSTRCKATRCGALRKNGVPCTLRHHRLMHDPAREQTTGPMKPE